MIRIDNAVIMAAGMSTRLAPLSYEKPKALLTIHGEVLIERQISQLQEAGIEDITVIVGYHREQFEYLKEKCRVTLIENPYYLEKNNHSSLYVAKEKLKNTYVSCSDYYFRENPFRREEERPYYTTMYKQGKTDEWCVFSDSEGKITEVVIGGKDAWVMQGIVLFDERFSGQLIPLLEKAFEDPKAADTYWEDLYLEHIQEMVLYEKREDAGNVLEFDSFEELREQVPEYLTSSGCHIMEAIAERLKCEEKDLYGFAPVKKGNHVSGVCFRYREDSYTYDYGTGKLCVMEGK